ncbi:MAG TPA: SDR family NAD(P)-dependent oxidoreductase, partial [Burkholderiaceae bacterium]
MHNTLQDRCVVVTGGLGFLGKAVAQQLRERGARVAVIDFAPAAGQPDTIGAVDLADPQAAGAAFAQAAAMLGRIDGLVSVAGGFAWETVEQGALATW